MELATFQRYVITIKAVNEDLYAYIDSNLQLLWLIAIISGQIVQRAGNIITKILMFSRFHVGQVSKKFSQKITKPNCKLNVTNTLQTKYLINTCYQLLPKNTFFLY